MDVHLSVLSTSLCDTGFCNMIGHNQTNSTFIDIIRHELIKSEPNYKEGEPNPRPQEGAYSAFTLMLEGMSCRFNALNMHAVTRYHQSMFCFREQPCDGARYARPNESLPTQDTDKRESTRPG